MIKLMLEILFVVSQICSLISVFYGRYDMAAWFIGMAILLKMEIADIDK
jgi:hypothetical protein